MIVFYGILLALAVGWATGGRLSGLSSHRLRYETTLMVLFIVIALAPSLTLPISDKLLVLGAWIIPALLCTGVAVFNLKQVGFGLIVSGLLLNLVVVAANVGMPVATANLALIQESENVNSALDESWLHEASEPDTRLLILADIIPVPGPKNFRAMLSLGDLFLILGIAKFIFIAMHENPQTRGENAKLGGLALF